MRSSFPHPAAKWDIYVLYIVYVLCILCPAGAGANDSIPQPAPGKPVLLRGGVIHPVDSPDLDGADLLIDGATIKAIGRALAAPPDAEVVELRGRHVYPALIAPNSALGLGEYDGVRPTLDVAESGMLNPNARAQVSINPDSELLPVTRSNGVLCALAVPQASDGAIAGLSALIRLDGWTWEDMTVLPAAGLHIHWPEMRIDRSRRAAARSGPEEQQKEIDRRMRELREFFAAARAYHAAAAAGALRGAPDARFEAMRPVLAGAKPVFVHAHEWKQLEAALAWGETEKLRLVIVGGQDAWRVADRLRTQKVPVICSAPSGLPLRRDDGYESSYALAGKLHAAGVAFCIGRPGSVFESAIEANLPYEAAMAAAHGLPREEALRAVTLYPAQILGAGDRLGSLAAGKEATLFVSSGDPLEIATQIEQAWIAGRPVDLSSKHTRLRDKYRRKLGQ